MDLRKLADSLISIAKMAAPLVPMAGAGAQLAEKVIDIFDTVGDDIPVEKQAEVQAARAELAEAVKAKAARTSDRLRG